MRKKNDALFSRGDVNNNANNNNGIESEEKYEKKRQVTFVLWLEYEIHKESDT